MVTLFLSWKLYAVICAERFEEKCTIFFLHMPQLSDSGT